MALLSRSRTEIQPLTEADVYARCHGDRGPDFVRLTVVPRPRPRVRITGEMLRREWERRLGYRPNGRAPAALK